MKKFAIFIITLGIFCNPAFSDNHDTQDEDKKSKKCESWKQERGNKYKKVPGSRLVCADKDESK